MKYFFFGFGLVGLVPAASGEISWLWPALMISLVLVPAAVRWLTLTIGLYLYERRFK